MIGLNLLQIACRIQNRLLLMTIFYRMTGLMTGHNNAQNPHKLLTGMRYILLMVCLLWLSMTPAQAQPPDATPLTPGELITGTISASQPRMAYAIEGARGEILRFRLTATDGTLDPVLTVMDATGAVLLRRDDGAGSSRNIEAGQPLERTGRYYIVVTRFGQSLGSTSGAYELLVERVGVLSEQGSTLQYGVPVVNTIDNTTPQIYYTLRAEEGDILNIDMVRSSGTLDPFLQLVDSNRFLIAENDDAPGGNTRDALIDNLLIEETGTYIVVATRYREAAGDSAGGFVLTVDESRNSGLGNSRLAPAGIGFNQVREGNLTDSRPQRYYRFTAQENQLVTIVLERSGGLLDAYVQLADADYNILIEDDDSGSGQNARIGVFRIPADGVYHIIATRAGLAEGTTEGRYRLQLQDAGRAFAGVPSEIPRLVYGTALQDTITAEDTDSLYVFRGRAGDVITVRMNRVDGTLDPVLELLDSDRIRMLYNDDGGSGNNAALERYTLPYTGTYYIRATRYTGSTGPTDTTGAFNLLLQEVTPADD
jgi:hypothetical protein